MWICTVFLLFALFQSGFQQPMFRSQRRSVFNHGRNPTRIDAPLKFLGGFHSSRSNFQSSPYFSRTERLPVSGSFPNSFNPKANPRVNPMLMEALLPKLVADLARRQSIRNTLDALFPKHRGDEDKGKNVLTGIQKENEASSSKKNIGVKPQNLNAKKPNPGGLISSVSTSDYMNIPPRFLFQSPAYQSPLSYAHQTLRTPSRKPIEDPKEKSSFHPLKLSKRQQLRKKSEEDVQKSPKRSNSSTDKLNQKLLDLLASLKTSSSSLRRDILRPYPKDNRESSSKISSQKQKASYHSFLSQLSPSIDSPNSMNIPPRFLFQSPAYRNSFPYTHQALRTPNRKPIEDSKLQSSFPPLEFSRTQKRRTKTEKSDKKSAKSSNNSADNLNQKVLDLLESLKPSSPPLRRGILRPYPKDNRESSSKSASQKQKPFHYTFLNSQLRPKPPRLAQALLPDQSQVRVPLPMFNQNQRRYFRSNPTLRNQKVNSDGKITDATKNNNAKSKEERPDTSPELEKMVNVVRKFLFEQKKREMARDKIPFYSKPHTKISSVSRESSSKPKADSVTSGRANARPQQRSVAKPGTQSKTIGEDSNEKAIESTNVQTYKVDNTAGASYLKNEGKSCVGCQNKGESEEKSKTSNHKISLSFEPETLKLLRKSTRALGLRPIVIRNKPSELQSKTS